MNSNIFRLGIAFVALMALPAMAQDLITVDYSKTAALDPFDPDAVWIGTGTTDGGEAVNVRAFGLELSPGDGFTNIDKFTFQVLDGDSLLASLDMSGTFTPTGDLTGVTGDISLIGSQNSTLMSSTVNGLVTTMGSVSFEVVPEPSTFLAGTLALGLLVSRIRRR